MVAAMLRGTKLWAGILLGGLVLGLATLVRGMQTGYLSLLAFRILLPALLTGYVLCFLLIRSRFKRAYAKLPEVEQATIRRRNQKWLRRLAFRIKVWWCLWPFAVALTQTYAGLQGLREHLVVGGVAVLFLVYSIVWFRSIRKALERLDGLV